MATRSISMTDEEFEAIDKWRRDGRWHERAFSPYVMRLVRADFAAKGIPFPAEQEEEPEGPEEKAS